MATHIHIYVSFCLSLGATERLSDAPPGLTAENRRKKFVGCAASLTTPSRTWLERNPPRRGLKGHGTGESCKSNVYSDPAPALTRRGEVCAALRLAAADHRLGGETTQWTLLLQDCGLNGPDSQCGVRSSECGLNGKKDAASDGPTASGLQPQAS